MKRFSRALIAVAAILSGCNSHAAGTVVPAPASGYGAGLTGVPSPGIIQSGQSGIWRYFAYPSGVYPLQSGVVIGSDKNTWVADNNSALIRITMQAQMKVFTLPPVTLSGKSVTLLPTGITVGSDGKFYMTTSDSSNIGAIEVATTSGTNKAYAVPASEQPGGNAITLGPDNNVWFPEFSHIAKITTGGAVTQYAYPTPNGGSGSGVTKGPDGNVWFTEHYNGIVAKIVPSTSKITEFKIAGTSAGSCTVLGITSGPDGNLYAVGADCIKTGYELLKVTTSGAVSAFLLPSAIASPSQSGADIMRGPDNNIWIPNYNNNELAVFHPSSSLFSLVAPPTTSTCFYNCVTLAGRDGNVWEVGEANGVSIYLLKILTVTPKSLTFTGTGQNQSITGTETSKPTLSAVSSNTAIATVTAGSTANTFVVHSVAIGTANVTVRDNIGNSFVVPATVK